MGVNLWQDIDAYLEAALLADMGPGTYGTLELSAATITVGDARAFRPAGATLPHAVIHSFDVDFPTGGPFGDGSIHLEPIVYDYMLFAFVGSESVATVRDNAQEMIRRFRELYRSRPTFGGLTSTDGERVQRVELRPAAIGIVGRSGTDRGEYLGWARLPMNVITGV